MSDEQKKEATVEATTVEKPKENEPAAKEQNVENKETSPEASQEKESTSKKETAEPKIQAENTEEKKNKKINLMTLKEIDQAIEKTKKNQGGLFSRYGFELIKRKEFLSKSTKK